MAGKEEFELVQVSVVYCSPDKHGSELTADDITQYVFHVPKIIERYLNEHQEMLMQVEELEEEIKQIKKENERLKSQLFKRVT